MYNSLFYPLRITCLFFLCFLCFVFYHDPCKTSILLLRNLTSYKDNKHMFCHRYRNICNLFLFEYSFGIRVQKNKTYTLKTWPTCSEYRSGIQEIVSSKPWKDKFSSWQERKKEENCNILLYILCHVYLSNFKVDDRQSKTSMLYIVN